jgi:drug/metabolite transporter (DMT)-like permease
LSERARIRTFVLTSVTLVAFAANSVLCRLALGDGDIDAASFSAIRLTSGAVALFIISRGLGRRRILGRGGGWKSAAMLFLYAVPFSFAYLSLSTGTGALILFAAVQITMIAAALVSGERLGPLEWVGLAVALCGLLYLVSPGLAAPSLSGSLLMITAGVSWGVYSLRGRGVADAIAATTDNFVRSVPFVAAVGIAFIGRAHVSTSGVALAVSSGALASGLGYVLWYAALRGLSASQAGIVQLSVPVLAALGGVVFMAESITTRLVLSAVLTLGGVAVAVMAKQKRSDRP